MYARKIPSAISLVFWSLAVVMVGLLTWRFHRESTEVVGITEASESIASSASNVEILAIRAAPGQTIRIRDTLAILLRPELESRIHEVERELQHTLGTASISASETERRVAETKAAFESRATRNKAEIARLKSERDRNRELVSGFIASPSLQDSTDPMLMRIRALELETEVDRRSTNELLGLLQGSRGAQNSSTTAMREALQKELLLLRSEKDALTLLANADGIVGNVHYRPGEKVSAFSPILTISDASPTLVRGYIHESLYSRVSQGDSVMVSSSGQRAGKVLGVVAGVGSKIVEFPVRLRKNPLIAVWGRELMVRIPARNPFLLNEMVTILPLGRSRQ